MFSVVPYYYRDAANYKEFDSIVIDGVLSPKEIKAIESKLNDGEYFIPADLRGMNLPELQDRLGSFPSEDDHVWHTLELDSLEVVQQAPEGSTPVPKATVVAAFARIKDSNDWDIAGCMDRLDLTP